MKTLSVIFSTLMLTAVFSMPPASASIVINEFLADPPSGLFGDANLDGVRSSSDDEFIELLNTGTEEVLLGEWSLWDSSQEHHAFDLGTRVAPGGFLVVFGGGSPDESIPSALTASSGKLSLNNGGDTIYLKDALGNIIDFYTYGDEGGLDQSLVRSPEGTGGFMLHSEADARERPFSPGEPYDVPAPKTPSVPEPASLALISLGLFLASRQRFSQ